MLRGVNHNPLIINGKIQTGKSYGIRLQKTCLWRLNTLTLMPNLHVIENQCRARRKNNKGGVSKSRNFFWHATAQTTNWGWGTLPLSVILPLEWWGVRKDKKAKTQCSQAASHWLRALNVTVVIYQTTLQQNKTERKPRRERARRVTDVYGSRQSFFYVFPWTRHRIQWWVRCRSL